MSHPDGSDQVSARPWRHADRVGHGFRRLQVLSPARSTPLRAQSCASASRMWAIHTGPARSFFASADAGSTTRQNGATSDGEEPFASSSHAASATTRKKIEVDTGHVASTLCHSASSRRTCWMAFVVPRGTLLRRNLSSSSGLDISNRTPAGIPANGLSVTETCGGFEIILSAHDLVLVTRGISDPIGFDR